jgi:hypothetical protein
MAAAPTPITRQLSPACEQFWLLSLASMFCWPLAPPARHWPDANPNLKAQPLRSTPIQ